MKVALLQLELTAGDLRGNAEAIAAAALEQAKNGAQLCATPELALIGYEACDYLRYPSFVALAQALPVEIAARLAGSGCALLLGGVELSASGELLNSAILINNGKAAPFCAKRALRPEEKPYFSPGDGSAILELAGERVAVCLGEDWRDCQNAPEAAPFSILANMSASPFAAEEIGKRETAFSSLAVERQCAALNVNAAGASDGLIYAGGSFAVNPQGACGQASHFAHAGLLFDSGISAALEFWPEAASPRLIQQALVFGVRQYFLKSGQSKAVLGLSGGIDSALVAALACDALGPENVTGLLMPSPWSSGHSVADAKELAANLGMKSEILPIQDLMKAFSGALARAFAGLPEDVAEENVQARIRGVLVMAWANKFGMLALATGNKSELAVGYSTMYGDSCGALEVIGDLYKTEVYEISRHLNASQGGVIPENILAKEPSAELRPGQTDRDSLPPYNELDGILRALLDKRLDVEQTSALGYPKPLVQKVAKLVARAQFKRMQSPPVLRIHAPAFLRMPVDGSFPFDLN